MITRLLMPFIDSATLIRPFKPRVDLINLWPNVVFKGAGSAGLISVGVVSISMVCGGVTCAHVVCAHVVRGGVAMALVILTRLAARASLDATINSECYSWAKRG